MDRLNRYRKAASCGLALSLALAAAGCKTPRSEVPPGPIYSNGGQTSGPVGFSSQPNPVDGSAAVPGGSQYGIPAPGSNPTANYGVPSATFGAPGTNLGAQSTMPPSSGIGMSGSPGGSSNPMTGFPQSGTGSTGPAAGIGSGPSR